MEHRIATFLKRLGATWIAAAFVAAAVLASGPARAQDFITVASTTSTEQSGLFKHLLPEFRKATGILGGLWEKLRERPQEFLDRRILESEGLDIATRDFLAGMTDRYAVNLFEQLYIPKPWIGPAQPDSL